MLTTAQLVVDHHSLPDFGDTILYKTDRKPPIQIGNGGESQLWDFSRLSSPYSDEISFSSPAGLDVHADMVVRQNGNLLFLLHWYDSDLMIIGQYDNQQLSQGVNKVSRFSEPAFFRKEKLSYGDSFEQDYIQQTSYATNDLSFELLNSLAEIPDSINVIRETRVKYEVDGWGTVILPISREPVLRLQIDMKETVSYVAIKDGLETRIGHHNFLDQLVEPEEIRDISYHYYSEDSKMPLVIVETDNRGDVKQATFQIDKEIFKEASPFNEGYGLSAYPNPSTGPVRFDFFGYPQGKYTIKVFNTILKTIWSETFEIDQNGVVDIDLGFLQKGTYVYGVDNENGERLLTKKLLIINP